MRLPSWIPFWFPFASEAQHTAPSTPPTFKSPEYGRARPDDIHDGQAGPKAQFEHEGTISKRRLEDNDPITLSAPAQPPLGDSICSQCAQLYFGKAARKAKRIRESAFPNHRLDATELNYGIFIASVGHQYRRLKSTSCALCRILCASRIHRENDHIESNSGDELRLIGFLDKSGLVKDAHHFFKVDSGFLAVVPQDFGSTGDTKEDDDLLRDHIYNEGAAVVFRDGRRPAIFAAEAVSPYFEASIASRWLHYCKANHSLLCGGLIRSPVSGLRLIDCTTLTVREVESSKAYTALSYVWGKRGDVDTKLRYTDNGILLPAKVSAVISDAISVTKALGLQYLWVDKFCIDQNDPISKHHQIQQMNAIYQNADLTIIAAAGTDETYGLPGVGERLRIPQKTAWVYGHSVISTMKDPHLLIKLSRWASRGWTFQEAVLSRRRLVFTDEQLYFECNSMNCFESIYSPLDTLHTEDKSRFRDDIRTGMFGRGKTEMYGKLVPSELSLLDVFHQYISAVEDYTSRDLSYDADSLNAFRGIIERYSKLEQPLNAIWGMPYLAQGTHRNVYFSAFLTWTHIHSCWDGAKGPRRRREFPSWTWAGWAGAVQIHQEITPQFCLCCSQRYDEYFPRIPMAETLCGPPCMESVLSVKLGNWEDEKSLESLDSTTAESKFHVLRLFAKTLPPSLLSRNRCFNDRKWRWVVGESHGELSLSQNSMHEAESVEDLEDVGRWRCILIYRVCQRHDFMVLKYKLDTNTWERAGMLIAHFDLHTIENGVMQNSGYSWYDIE